MSLMGNTDAHSAKPKFNYEREVENGIKLPIFAGNTAGNNVITLSYLDGGANNVANLGVTVGSYVYFWAGGNYAANGGQNGNGVPGFYASNTKVQTISGNTVTLGTNLFGTVDSTFVAEFDPAIAYNANKVVETTYNQDTILITPTRFANTNVNVVPAHTGWNHIQKKVNADGTVRYISETLAVLANPVASNLASGNTSWGTAVHNL
jgi:hypothetical protein